MGPQSSGKSTLMNQLFNTRFFEMDALSRRGQTTQARAAVQSSPFALVWPSHCAS